MAMSIKIVTNSKRWTRDAVKATDVFGNGAMVNSVSNMLESRIRRLNREQFLAEGRGKSGRWKPLSAAYLKWKSLNFPGKTILRRTDRLFKAATSSIGSTTRGVRTSLGYSFTYTILVPYSDAHQKGIGVPQRKIFDPNEQQGRGISAAIGRTIASGLLSRPIVFRGKSRFRVFRNTGFDRIDV